MDILTVARIRDSVPKARLPSEAQFLAVIQPDDSEVTTVVFSSIFGLASFLREMQPRVWRLGVGPSEDREALHTALLDLTGKHTPWLRVAEASQ